MAFCGVVGPGKTVVVDAMPRNGGGAVDEMRTELVVVLTSPGTTQ